MSGLEMQLVKFNGVQESLLLIPLDRRGTNSAGAQQYLSTGLAWALISLESEGELQGTVRAFTHWRDGLSSKQLITQEVAEVDHWRVQPPLHLAEKERHLWRQSEVILRIAQSREPNRPGRNNNGLMLASLPEGPWFMPWVRDMATGKAKDRAPTWHELPQVQRVVDHTQA